MLTLLASRPHVVVGKSFRAETLESFVQAGLHPGKPAPEEDSGVQEGDHRGVQGDHLNTLNLQHKLELTELRVKLPSFSGHPNRVVSLRYPHYTRDIRNTARQKALPHSAINASLSGS